MANRTASSTIMPPEWHPHSACLILYPHNTGVFRSSTPDDTSKNSTSSITTTKCQPARSEVRNVARSIRDYGKEDVFLFCNTEDDFLRLQQELKNEEEDEGEKWKTDKVEDLSSRKNRIFVKVCPSDDSWCRDTGPTFTITNSTASGDNSDDHQSFLIGLDWKFNAYGGPKHGCYWPCHKDQEVAKNIISILNQHYSPPTTSVPSLMIQHEQVDLILEGGSIHTDGEGTILTTEECLLNPNRNPNLTKAQIEQLLLKHLGGTKVIWLPYGLAFDDDTNGHVDNIATFARPAEIVLSWTTEEEDSVNYERFLAAEKVIKNEVDARGRRIEIHKLHVPSPMYYTHEDVKTLNTNNEETQGNQKDDAQACDRMEGERLAASYVNYYRANKAIILPQFGDSIYDQKAMETMQRIFPDLEVRGVFSREILLGGGNIHCITQQVPDKG